MPADVFGHVPAPSGTIAYWDDDPANLPSEWVVCDGNNGTPNLLDRFVKNVPDGSTNPGATGGQSSYSLSQAQLPAHDHYFGSTDSAGGHSHQTSEIDGSDNGTDVGSNAEDNKDYGNGDHTYSVSGSDHSHSLNFGNTGSGNSIDGRPSFHELVPIMKL